MLENLKIGPEYEGFLFLAESARNPPVLKPHRHVELELNIVVSGAVTYVVKGQRYRFPKRSLIWFFPSQEHQLVDRTQDARYYVAVFKPEMIRKVCVSDRYAGLLKDRPEVDGVLHAELEPGVYSALESSLPEFLKDGLDADLLNQEAGFGLSEDFSFEHGDPDFLNAGLRILLLRCWRIQLERGVSGKQVKLHEAVRKALDLLESGECSDDLDMLAEICGVSSAYLSRRFRKEVGVTLSRYRNSIKLGRFWSVYRESKGITVLEAAFEAGFGSYAQFYRVFVSAYGQSPREVFRV
ncbi:AraC family transcriptional regulator [Pelagicoccus mobilis]|uniref:AraC family transcriptional regulator n=1 Tax=Pelagicoccus mobilis TaxID=415221 RepID=A0A934VPK2_9BACT|nr:AraC family transcriptional regulator [Pelagicoccus mobilis]MBK1875614.1 AraC family transcriptional regulator [Pelagicoccus mobilis]